MNDHKYIGMDVHKATIVAVVLDYLGNVSLQSIVQTKNSSILEFLEGIRGTLHVTFEEGCQAEWLYDLMHPHVAEVVVCNPKKNIMPQHRADKPDAKYLAESLRTGGLKPVYHGKNSAQTIKECARSYTTTVRDNSRVKNRIKAIFRGRGIDCGKGSVYDKDHHEQWLNQLADPALRKRAARLFKQLDFLTELCDEAGEDLSAETRKHPAAKILRGVPGIALVRAGVIIGYAMTPFRFRTRKQFWAYCGLAVTSRITGEYVIVGGQVRRSGRVPLVRGLNRNYNRALKEAFKGAATTASQNQWKPQFEAMVANGTDPALARLTLARKIASTVWSLWRKGERYDERKMNFSHAA